MRNRITRTVIAVTAVAAITVAWSMSAKIAGKGKPTEASAPISPHDIAAKQGNTLPVEYWSHPRIS